MLTRSAHFQQSHFVRLQQLSFQSPSLARLPCVKLRYLSGRRQPGARGFQTSTVRSVNGQFSYRIAASYTGKGNRYIPEKNIFDFDPSLQAQPRHPSEAADRKAAKRDRPDSGHDAFFVSGVGKTGAVAFGVADGVGGFVESGIDPADFSHGLCHYMANAAYNFPEHFRTERLSPQDLMQAGYYQVVHDKTIEGGGSTACVATAQPNGSLEVANLGDSGFLQLRLNAVHHYSDPQTHAFNTPYQLSAVPPRILSQIAAFGGNVPYADMPKDSTLSTHQLRHGDVLVFGTDGLWDNLSSEDTLNIVSRNMTSLGGWKETADGVEVGTRMTALTAPEAVSGTRQQGISKPQPRSLQAVLAVSIIREAKSASTNLKRDGPFARKVQNLYPKEVWRGGKVDDICVVIVIVVERSGSATR